jgi:hypothetical protein
MQVQYEIAPISTQISTEMHLPYFKQLEQTIGKAYKAEILYENHDLYGAYASSSVVFSAKWLIDDIRISLSVYGGMRENDLGLSAAGIFLDWTNEIEAAKPYRGFNEQFEKEIADCIHADIAIKKIKLENKQRSYFMANDELSDLFVAQKETELRAAQLAIYRRALYLTPTYIQEQLNENEVAYYAIPELNKLFISTKWDTIYLLPENENVITFWEILPARGIGARELDLKELILTDGKHSNALLELIQWIQTNTQQVCVKKDGYDD